MLEVFIEVVIVIVRYFWINNQGLQHSQMVRRVFSTLANIVHIRDEKLGQRPVQSCKRV